MKKQVYLLMVALLAVCMLHAQIKQQYVIASTGGFSKMAGGSASYTIGEMSMVKTFRGGNAMLTQGFLQGNIVANNNGELPVKLLDFTGYYDGGVDHLEWHTASELNNDHFELQRMTDDGDFASIGTIKGAGTTTQEQAYTFDDNNPLSGVNYYRLKQVDIDGNFAYSDIVAITTPANGSLSISIFPNPAKNYVNISVSAIDNGSGQLELVDILGKVIYQQDISLSSGTTVTRLDLSSYETGQYLIRFTSSTVNKVTKVIKQ
jgi:hypothetical protein